MAKIIQTQESSTPSAPSDSRWHLFFKSDGLYIQDSSGNVYGPLFGGLGLATLSGIITPTQITGDQNDYNPANLSTANTLRLSSDASRNITGLQGGAAGRLLLVHNVGAQNIVLKDESGSSSAANRFALTADMTMTPDTLVWLQYDATSLRWRLAGGGGGGGTWGSITGTLTAQTDLQAALDAKVSNNGWVRIAGTFSWASASTINVASGAVAIYQVGYKLKWTTQTGPTQRYATIIGVADTLLTIAVNTDHPLVNETWTLPYYSPIDSPIGFPAWFNFASTPGNFVVGAGGTFVTKFNIKQKKVEVFAYFKFGTGSSVSGDISFSTPFAWSDDNYAGVMGRIGDSGTGTYLSYIDITLSVFFISLSPFLFLYR